MSGIKIDELFYELEVRTSGVKGGIDDAERSLGRFTKFVKANPMAALAALGAAIVATGAKAAQMAADVERAGRRIETVFPGITKEARALSNEFGVAQAAVVRLFDTVERNGERTRTGLQTTARAALQLNQALGGTPDDLQAIAGALDQVLDLFHLSGDDAERVAAQLFTLSKGRVPVSELTDAFRASASTIRDNNLTLEEAAGALVKLLEAGLPARQAASALNEEVAKGRDSFRAFVGPVDDSTTALQAFTGQVAAMGETADVAIARLHERLSNTMIALGNRILPLVNAELQGMLGLLDHISGTTAAFDAIDLVGRTADRVRQGKTLSDGERGFAEREVSRLAQEVAQGDLQLGALGANGLKDLERNLQALDKQIQNPVAEAARVRLLGQIHALGRPAAVGSDAPKGSTAEELAAGQAVLDGLSKSLAELTGNLADQTRAALADFQAKVAAQAATIPPEQAAQFKVLTDQIVDQYRQQLVIIRSGIENVQPGVVGGSADPRRPNVLQPLSGDRRKAVQDAITDSVQDTTDALNDEARQREEIVAKAGEELSHAQATAHVIESAVRGALQLAEAFGGVDEATASILSNIAQVAAGIGPLSVALKNLKAGTGGAGDVIGAALPIVGGIAAIASSLFGESPEEKALRAALERTADRIEELTKELGNLGQFAISGNQVGEGLAGIARFAADPDGFRRLRQIDPTNRSLGDVSTQNLLHGLVNQRALDAALAQSGTSRAELQALADSLGLEVNFSTQNFSDLAKAFEALNAALREAELTKFAQTFAGQLDALHARFELFDITDPIQQLQQLVALQGKVITNADGTTTQLGSSALANAFAGLDLNTVAGQDEATKRLQALFEQLNSADQLSPEQQAALLGGLTGQQFLDALLQLEALLDQAKQQGSTGQTEGFAVQRSITEVTGSRLAGILTSSDARLQELVELTRQEVALMGGRPYAAEASAAAATIAAPATVVAAGGDVVIESVQVTAPDGTADPVTWGRAAGRALGAEVDAVLGQRIRQKARHMGRALTTG